jgi:Ca2+/H+ antiporter
MGNAAGRRVPLCGDGARGILTRSLPCCYACAAGSQEMRHIHDVEGRARYRSLSLVAVGYLCTSRSRSVQPEKATTMANYLLFLLGVIAAGAGGELFVRGAVGLAHWARIPAGIIGATVAAFATSSPECAVAVSAALAGTPGIALGDALGSNIVNVALILGLVVLLADLQVPRDSLKRDFPVAMLTPCLLAVLALDGVLSRVDGCMLLGVFVTWLIATVLEARRQRSAAEHVWERIRPDTPCGQAL